MNEITIHGNLTADPVLREGQSGKPFLTCTVAVNRSYYAADRGTRVDLPAVFHSVIAFNQLADNAAQTLAKGMTVTVTGYLADNSYTDPATGQTIRRTRLEAGDIAVSLRFATAQVTKRTATSQTDQSGQSTEESPAADNSAS
jgi:single-strand DNA-binding protein